MLFLIYSCDWYPELDAPPSITDKQHHNNLLAYNLSSASTHSAVYVSDPVTTLPAYSPCFISHWDFE